MNQIVLDASIITDMFIINRPRHVAAVEIIRIVQSKNIEILLPMHAILEIKCAVDNERLKLGNGQLSVETPPITFIQIPIDANFISNYLDIKMPYIKAGDLPYILIAKKENCCLITEDKKQYNVSQRAGVLTFSSDEFIKYKKE